MGTKGAIKAGETCPRCDDATGQLCQEHQGEREARILREHSRVHEAGNSHGEEPSAAPDTAALVSEAREAVAEEARVEATEPRDQTNADDVMRVLMAATVAHQTVHALLPRLIAALERAVEERDTYAGRNAGTRSALSAAFNRLGRPIPSEIPERCIEVLANDLRVASAEIDRLTREHAAARAAWEEHLRGLEGDKGTLHHTAERYANELAAVRSALTAVGCPRQDDEPAVETLRRAWDWCIYHAHKAQAAQQKAEEERDLWRTALGLDGNWPALEVIRKLVGAADHLLRDHNCDTHGWEEIGSAVISGRAILERVEQIRAEGPQ